MFDSMFCNGNTAAPNYDSKTGLCKCGVSGMLNKVSSGCSNETPFCVNGTCLCSQSLVSYVKGASPSKGTCHGTETCLDDGSCVGMELLQISFTLAYWYFVKKLLSQGLHFCIQIPLFPFRRYHNSWLQWSKFWK